MGLHPHSFRPRHILRAEQAIGCRESRRPMAMPPSRVGAVPGVRKAVKWNSPLYGVESQGWFLSFHCYTKYIKVAFFRGTSLRPVPPGQSKQKEVRYLDIHEDGQFDEAQFADWVK